jgi:hypothetical protein
MSIKISEVKRESKNNEYILLNARKVTTIKDRDSTFPCQYNRMPSYSSFDCHMILGVRILQDIEN